MEPVYILIRTSNRPKFFHNMFESIIEQTYKNIVTIVHIDDPKDEEYVSKYPYDILIRGKSFPRSFGNATYNLYNNRLLDTIPINDKNYGPGWFHFIDDDDMYHDKNVFEKLVKKSKKDHINLGRVKRGGSIMWPKSWGDQESYQTECFFLHTDNKDLGRWWGKKGGDHHYSKQITEKLPKNWIEDLYICKAQEGKGRGKRLDLGQSDEIESKKKMVPVIYLKKVRYPASVKGNTGEKKTIPIRRAEELEMRGRVKLFGSDDGPSFDATEIEFRRGIKNGTN